MSRVPVSVYVITKNEEARIARALRSVIDWADEVLVVDSGSSDRTVAIAEEIGARVLHRDWTGYGPQKRFAEEQCRHKWVLNLDADEEVSPELASEIADVITSNACAACRIRITDILPGESVPRWHAYSYHVLRLYHRDFGQMSDHPYQDRVAMFGGVTRALAGRIYHRSFVSWEATVTKINFYTTEVARVRARGGKTRFLSLRLWTEFPLTFLKLWIGRRYALRGRVGMAMSLTVAYLNLLRLLKTEERIRGQPKSGAEDQITGSLSRAA